MNYLYFKCPLKAKNLSGAALYIGNFLSQYQSVDTLLNGKIKDYYVTCRLSDLYYLSNTTEDFKMVDSFIKRLDFSLSKDEYKFIDQEKNFVQKMLNIKYSLEPGTKAPGFYLKDEKGIVHNLSDYTGKIVYIHFWATWCEPCIKEIPSINQLHMKLINQPFEIINICLNDNVEKWRQIIEKEGLKGTNLICIGNWGNLLKNKYFITELPHFTLIDKNGIIIKNFSEGPGNISTNLIGLINI